MSCLGSVRAYDENLPKFLINRPHNFVEHCYSRILRVAHDIKSVSVVHDGVYSVQSRTSDKTYEVCVKKIPSCQCHDWHRSHMPCKHLMAVVMEYGWEQLDKAYTENPFFVLDASVIQQENIVTQDNELCGESHEPSTLLKEVSGEEHEEESPQSVRQTRNQSTNKSMLLADLKQLQEMVYLCTDESLMNDLRKRIKEMSSAISTNLPKSGGLILGKKCSTLPKKIKVPLKRKRTAGMTCI